jgi:glutamate-1-semialdehyde 2,1-aminomutase
MTASGLPCHLYMANRGIWDAMPTAGPQASFVHTAADVDLYLNHPRSFLKAIRA